MGEEIKIAIKANKIRIQQLKDYKSKNIGKDEPHSGWIIDTEVRGLEKTIEGLNFTLRLAEKIQKLEHGNDQ